MTQILKSPVGDNTIAAALTPAWVSPRTINVLTNRLAPLAACHLVVSPSPLGPRQTVLVPKITVGSTTWTNPTDFESGDSTAEVGATVLVNQLGNSFHLSNDQVQQGHGPLSVGLQVAAANNLANAVSDTITPLLKVSNGFSAQVIGLEADFSVDDMPAIYALCRDFTNKVLVLDNAYLSKLIELNRTAINAGESGAFGFDGIYEQNRWTGSDAGVVGFVADGGAGGIVAVSGLPLPQPAGQFMSNGSFTLAGLGISVESKSWYNTSTRITWAALSLMLGAAVGDAPQLVLLTSS